MDSYANQLEQSSGLGSHPVDTLWMVDATSGQWPLHLHTQSYVVHCVYMCGLWASTGQVATSALGSGPPLGFHRLLFKVPTFGASTVQMVSSNSSLDPALADATGGLGSLCMHPGQGSLPLCCACRLHSATRALALGGWVGGWGARPLGLVGGGEGAIHSNHRAGPQQGQSIFNLQVLSAFGASAPHHLVSEYIYRGLGISRGLSSLCLVCGANITLRSCSNCQGPSSTANQMCAMFCVGAPCLHRPPARRCRQQPQPGESK